MNIRLPNKLMDWVMQNKGDLPPQIFIIQVLEEHSKTINMTGELNEQRVSTAREELHDSE